MMAMILIIIKMILFNNDSDADDNYVAIDEWH